MQKQRQRKVEELARVDGAEEESQNINQGRLSPPEPTLFTQALWSLEKEITMQKIPLSLLPKRRQVICMQKDNEQEKNTEMIDGKRQETQLLE